MKRVVGILLDHDVFRGIVGRRTGYEHILLYNKAAQQLDLIPFYMSLRKVDKTSAVGLLYDKERFQLVRKMIPKVTHNRTIIGSTLLKKRMLWLRRQSFVFNQQNRYSKYRIIQLLTKRKSLSPYLPKTVKYSYNNLCQTMKEQKGIYLKPVDGSVGDGVIKLSKVTGNKWIIQWNKDPFKPVTQSLARALVSRRVGGRSYLIQEEIPLAQFGGRPYDLRVSVQRGKNGTWQITGMVGKVAAAGRHVTNIAKGGKIVPCETLFRSSGFNAETLKQSINRVSLEIAQYLGRKLPHLADLGLDIGVDREGRIQFIEMNGRDQRITFKKAGLLQTFYRTYETPLKYAKYLLQTVYGKKSVRPSTAY